MNYSVRTVQTSDISELLELCAEHAAYEKAEFALEGKAQKLIKAFEMQRLYGWVIEVSEGLVGFATATLDYSTWDAAEFLHMDCLYLKENVRGKGLGKQLFWQVTKLAKEKNCINIQWQTPDWNIRAMDFYNRLGATSKHKVRFFLDSKGD